MAEIINQIATFLEQVILVFGYPGMFAVQVLENVFTPIPSEPLLPLASMMAAQGKLNLIAIWASLIVLKILVRLRLFRPQPSTR